MIARIRHIAENEFLQSCILFLILVNAGLLGLMTYPSFSGSYRDYSEIILSISQVVFTIEIVIRIVVYAPNYKKFFAEFSNIFDFIIIIISFIPAV